MLVLLASCILVSAIYWQIGGIAKNVANDVIERSLEQSGRVLDARIENRYVYIQEIANGLANDGRLRPLIYEGESLTLQDLSSEYQRVYQFSSLFFLDANATILARSDQPNAIGFNLAGRSKLFDDAFSGNVSRGFFLSQGRLMQTVVVPVFDNVAKDLVKGAVVIAYELSVAIANEIEALTQSNIAFYVFTRDRNSPDSADGISISGVEASVVTDKAMREQLTRQFAHEDSFWKHLITNDATVIRKDFEIDNDLFHARLRRIDSKDGNALGFAMSYRSDTELRKPFTEIRQAVIVDGGITLVIASVLAFFMAIGVSRPIIRLVDMVTKVKSGEFPEKNLKSSARDEVGILQNAIIDMGQSIKEKAELEEYLAALADEVVGAESIVIQEDEKVKQDALFNVPQNHDNNDETIIQASSSSPSQDTSSLESSLIEQRFKLLSELGSGAMGKVFLAQDLALNEKIAIKVIDKSIFEKLEGFNFKEEIRLARKISHRNIVRTFDFGNWQNNIFISMEYVAGYDLGKLIAKKGPLELKIGLTLCKQICFAMISAHQMGIIHRDLKPANMIINRQGVLKIMDFGLAMQLQSDSSSDLEQRDDTSHTGSYMMGTPRFMAPEQFSINADVDERTDIYSIGIIMYTIFNGRPPFKGKNLNEIASLHRNAPIPDFDNSDSVPTELKEIIEKALAKEPAMRFQSVKELLDQINATF